MSTHKDSEKKSTYSKAAYAWLMTVTSYYKRVSDLGINIDELMTLNTVAAHWLYKVNASDTKSLDELIVMSSDEIKKYFKGSKLSILSIANILSQPKESIRRRVQKLIDFQLLARDENNGVILGENYTKIMGAFGEVTTKDLARLVSNLNDVKFVEEVSGINLVKELK
tara:strand:- start:398 stop:901 length:504 start_codon:yes stop_codon:yes gene_type:complete